MRNDEEFERIFKTCYARVWRYFGACGLSKEDAHDLAQITFKQLLEYKNELRNDDPWPLVQKTAHRVLLNHFRDAKAAKRSMKLVDMDDPDFNEEPAAPPEPDYAERQQEALRKKQLDEEIEKLPEGQRQAMRLWLAGLQYNEIAEALRTTLDAVRSRLRDARRLLVARLGDSKALPEDDV